MWWPALTVISVLKEEQTSRETASEVVSQAAPVATPVPVEPAPAPPPEPVQDVPEPEAEFLPDETEDDSAGSLGRARGVPEVALSVRIEAPHVAVPCDSSLLARADDVEELAGRALTATDQARALQWARSLSGHPMLLRHTADPPVGLDAHFFGSTTMGPNLAL